MSVQFPNTIAGLRACLDSGDLLLDQAVSFQVQNFDCIDGYTKAAVHKFASPAYRRDNNLPLAGVGVAHKDMFDLEDRAPGLGRAVGSQVAGVSQAYCLSQLEQAGAVNLGTLSMAEDACAATGQLEKLPTPTNPLGAEVAVGGSSSGSAVAVASGMVFASLGTDTAGSVRIPAMTCGVMGLKTTHGLISRDGMRLLCPSLDSIGILARGVDDLAAVMQVMAPDLQGAGASMTADLKVGYWLDQTDLNPEVREIVAAVMHQYGQQHIDLSVYERRATALQEIVMAYEIGQTHATRIANGEACRQVQGVGTYGLTIPESWWRSALAQRRERLREFVDNVFAQADVLIAPLQIGLLPKTTEVYLGQDTFESAKLLGLHRYCGWINYLGLPALSIPVGRASNHLPVSIQLVGKPFGESQLLALGSQIAADIHGKQGIEPVLRLEGHQA